MPPVLNTPLFSSTEFRAALGSYATGVTVVTCLDERGDPVGLTVNSFSSVSLTPPLVLWSLSKKSLSLAAFKSCTHFGVNVLTAGQIDLARRFSTIARNRWSDVPWQAGRTGVPVLGHTAAFFECASLSRHVEGDHIIFIGRVAHCESRNGAEPLLFFNGRYHTDHLLRTQARLRPAQPQ